MDPLFLVVVLALASTGFVLPRVGRALGERFTDRGRRRRSARRARPVHIADARRGEAVRVRGIVCAEDRVLTFPFSRRSGVFHATELVNTANPAGASSFSFNERCNLVIDDDTGSATIALKTPVDLIAPEASGAVDRDNPDLRRILGRRLDDLFGSTPLLWRQRGISVGDVITIWGKAEFEPTASENRPQLGGSYREMPRRLRLEAIDGEVVITVEESRRSPL